MRISRTMPPAPGDIVLDRDFSPAGSPMEFIGEQSDFYRFLSASSLSNATLIKKMSAIGFLLRNKAPRNLMLRAFICVNDADDDADDTECYGKSLFADAISQYCTTVIIDGRALYNDDFALSSVRKDTQLLHVEGLPRPDVAPLLNLCSADWTINRKGRDPLHISLEDAPYIILTSNRPASFLMRYRAFRSRVVPLEFSPFFGPENPIHEYLGRYMFIGWDKEQWHMFDNLMLYCVLEYTASVAKGEDIFFLYK